MPRKQIENQLSLLEPKYEYPITYGRPASYVGIAERAQYLVTALNAMSQRNIRNGFSVATFTMPDSKRIWSDYQEGTPNVLIGASKNREKYEEEIRVNFWRATGFAALRGTRIMREAQINPTAEMMWRNFNRAYGHPREVKARNSYKEQLEKTLEWTHEQGAIADVAM